MIAATVGVLVLGCWIYCHGRATSLRDELRTDYQNSANLSPLEMEIIFFAKMVNYKMEGANLGERSICPLENLSKKGFLTHQGKKISISSLQAEKIEQLYSQTPEPNWIAGAGLSALGDGFPMGIDSPSPYDKVAQYLVERGLVVEDAGNPLYGRKFYHRTSRGGLVKNEFPCQQ